MKTETNQQKIKNLKKEIGKMDVFLVCIFIFLLVFVCAMTYLTFSTGVEASTLIMSVFGFCGFECGFMASIQKRKMSIKADIEKLESAKESEKKKSQVTEDTEEDNTESGKKTETYKENNDDDDDMFHTPVIY